MFACLQENIAKSGFGDQCKQQVQDREARMQEDYRLDYGVASQCEADVNQYCSLEKVSKAAAQSFTSCLLCKLKLNLLCMTLSCKEMYSAKLMSTSVAW